MATILSHFHPLVARWFSERVGRPTEIQVKSWPPIIAGEHVLITAPTGSGKTLTAFLWAINQLLTGEGTGFTRILYVSPLKALNNDIQRNLVTPLEEMREVFQGAGETFPDIRVFTRSGDTPQSDRRRMLRNPPEILITTPESLNLLLSSKGGIGVLSRLNTVILDEIHAVVGNKRGTHLISAVERLVRLSGEFQRLSLSATVNPLEKVSRFVGGFIMEGESRSPRYRARPVTIVTSKERKEYQIQVRFPVDVEFQDIQDREPVWEPLNREFKKHLERNRSTLLFTNSRRICERVTYRLNDAGEYPLAYAHHGSLSRELREEVEHKLKSGDLKAIVSTSSLEMGIDIGDLDEVILVQSPPSVSSAIQRIGRAGHRVGEISRGTLYPTHPMDFLEAAVIAAGIASQDIEEVEPVTCPLDVLAQIIISMVGVETWDMDDLFNSLRSGYSYRNLSRGSFDLVINMLGGRYANSRIRELRQRLSIDRIDNTVKAKKGALLSLYLSGGTIPDRGYFKLKHLETGAHVGELDEEFVWEATIGQVMTLGTQNWKIQKITHNDVFVTPAGSSLMDAPFWTSEEGNRGFQFSHRILEFLEKINGQSGEESLFELLQNDHHMDRESARRLIDFLMEQKERTGADLPHRHHILFEYLNTGPGGVPGNQLIIHTLWGGKLNRPFAMALEAAWEERFGAALEIFPGNDCVVLQTPHEITVEELLALVTPGSVESLLRKRLEGSGFFAARFRENAGRALLITRDKINRRMPLWMTRLNAQKLMENVLRYDDFPILLETWRVCLQDEFDLKNLRRMLGELEEGAIRWSVTHTNSPSPLATGMSWNQINRYMYQGDQSVSGKSSNLRQDLLRDVLFSPDIRPVVSEESVALFEGKRQRLSPGYSPRTSDDLLDWVKERIAIPAAEWKQLERAIRRDTGDPPQRIIDPVATKLVWVNLSNDSASLLVACETLPLVMELFFKERDDISLNTLSGEESVQVASPDHGNGEWRIATSSLLGEWLRFYGPKSVRFIQETLGLGSGDLQEALSDLGDAREIVNGQLVKNGESTDVCDSENYESLLRINRAMAIPRFDPREIEFLAPFLAKIQGLTDLATDVDTFCHHLEKLLCLPLAAGNWEADVFPARSKAYRSEWLDQLTREGNLRWVGHSKQRVSFCFDPDLDLLSRSDASPPQEKESGSLSADRSHADSVASRLMALLRESSARYDFSSLLTKTEGGSSELSASLWGLVWRGIVTNDTFAALRKGIESKFKSPTIARHPSSTIRRNRRGGVRGDRTSFSAWKTSLPFVGNWFTLPTTRASEDLMELEETKKDRVRLLLDRYGILFRELLVKEESAFRWSDLFRSLRLMELSGEILAGVFFREIPGPQFMSHQAFRALQTESGMSSNSLFWLNATDPASLCGIPIGKLKCQLPERRTSNHLVFRGERLILVSEREGKSVTILIPPDDPAISDCFRPLHHLLTRQFKPLKWISVETINGESACASPYLNALKDSFELLMEFKKVTLYNKR